MNVFHIHGCNFLNALQTLSKMHSYNKECNNAFLYAHTSLLFLLLIKYTY